MTDDAVIKAALLAIPLWIGASAVIRTRWTIRLPAGLIAAIVIALLAVTVLDRGTLSYLVSFACMGGIYALLALGLNVQWGYAAHLNFGIAGLFAVGAFTTALFTTAAPTGLMANYTQQVFGLEAPFLVGMAAAGLVGGIVAFVIAVPVLRLRMDFLAIATLGVAEIIRRIFQNERWLANGPQPLRGIPQPLHCVTENPACGWLPDWAGDALKPLTPGDYNYLYVIIITLVLMVTYLLLEHAVRSPWGRVLRGTRDEEDAATMSGKNVTAVRIQSFVVGGVIMGVAGSLYAHFLVTIDYSHFRPLFATFLVWVMLMLGGSGNNRGAILGAFIIWGVWSGTAFLTDAIEPALNVISSDLASRAAYLRWLLVALVLTGIVLFRPQGILAEETIVSRHLLDRRRRKQGQHRVHERAT
ncbi:branched-chain amino acid ABC transporter permease [Salinisphaera sp. USBA-960]|nr:branched-chain amino acid ABC transporter permease [Salifodinibacter halophilus]NNC27099.1 branched-chain amino acid ABC transporter permease [Salifodinibacter halophilus]